MFMRTIIIINTCFNKNMTNTNDKKHRGLLQKIARRVMLERGLLPDFSRQALAELDGIHEPEDKR